MMTVQWFDGLIHVLPGPMFSIAPVNLYNRGKYIYVEPIAWVIVISILEWIIVR